MNISYKWLSQYVDIDCSPQELADKMTMAGIEVEAIEQTGLVPEGIVVGEILERNPHPGADKLSVCKVFDGEKELQVVCGAPNCDAGKKVPLATIGTVFVDPEDGSTFKIKKSKLRGEKSFGMMCSASELNLDGDNDGLLELSAEYKAGTPLNDLLETDTLYEVEITPNRPDWLSHWGVARDVQCLLNKEAKFPEVVVPSVDNPEVIENLVTVENSELCPRYTARVIRNVQVKESPEWLKERLMAIGLRPINNIVDITNFVLHELGHPLHAFDMDELAENRIVVRNARDGEKMTLLDETELELAERHLVICDAEKPVCLAGVMGGLHSGVTEKTTNVLLESAVFFKSNVRSTSRELKISSDSSYRFERGVDWNNAQTASDRAVQLILELAGGELATELVDVNTGEPEMPVVEFDFNWCRKIIGVGTDCLSNDVIINIFEKLCLNVESVTENTCLVKVPTFRLDIERQADLDEEVARIFGLDNIPMDSVTGKCCSTLKEDSYYKLEKARNELIAMGLHECMHYSMIAEKSALKDSRFEKDDLLWIDNPLNLDFAVMRPSLFGEMLATVERNFARKNYELELFEIGKVFCANTALYPEERFEVCIALSGSKHPERFSEELKDNYDFYDMKGMLESWFDLRKISDVRFEVSEDGKFEAGYAAKVIINGKVAGEFGKLKSEFTRKMKTSNDVFFAFVSLESIIDFDNSNITFEPVSQYPSTTRDVAFVADEALQNSEVVDFIRKSKLKNLENVELFDIFRDEKVLGENKKSMAYTLTFRNKERTLTDKEVNNAYEKLRKKMANNLPIELR